MTESLTVQAVEVGILAACSYLWYRVGYAKGKFEMNRQWVELEQERLDYENWMDEEQQTIEQLARQRGSFMLHMNPRQIVGEDLIVS